MSTSTPAPTAHATTPVPGGSAPMPAKNPGRRQLPRAPALDFSQIRTAAPPHVPSRSRARVFELEHCPIFYPSVDEFAEPMEYIERVAKESKDSQYGICKIVPPEGWKPPFALDTETFRFKTRLQKLNSMEASARANVNFLEQLYIFHRQQKDTTVSIPVIGTKPVDLWKLRKEVNALGGHDVVLDNGKWEEITEAMGFSVKSGPSIPGQLKVAYAKIIKPFEEYRIKVLANTAPTSAIATPPPAMRSLAKTSVSEEPATPELAGSHADPATPLAAMQGAKDASEALNTALQAATMPKTEPEKPKTAAEAKMGAPTTLAASGPLGPPGEYCEICSSDHDDQSILLCDDCDRGFHLKCLDPPLEEVPSGHWICDACIVSTGADYGFEEGNEHTFASFHSRASEFRKQWLESHPLPETEGGWKRRETVSKGEDWVKEIAVEDHLEREFWRLVESPNETVEVEYGADLHTTKWGSGAPSIESHPAEPYSRDGWNLNNLPILHGSLLRYVKSDISGMTVPWGYVGMIFSTFAWHKEDHYTYSVNYHHWGGTKTWYGVPGEDDVKLEAAMKAAAPELFQQQPDLMYQLVTLMSPGRLKKAGVRVSACDQRPNEFVITFPKAYHAGFNHDMNYNEAVNFCLPDWLEQDLTCVKQYKEMHKAPVFSHDELLVTIYHHERNAHVSRWLLPQFEEMIAREIAERAAARRDIPDLREMLEDEERPDEYLQCQTDKSYCYLSQITSPSCNFVTCPDHFSALGANVPLVMKCRFSDDELRAMVEKIKKRAGIDGAQAKRKADMSEADLSKRQRVDDIAGSSFGSAFLESSVMQPLPEKSLLTPATAAAR